MMIRRKVDFSQSQADKEKNSKEEGHCELTPCPGALYQCGFLMGLWCDYQKGDEEGGQVAGKSWELPLVLWAEQRETHLSRLSPPV